MKSSVIRGTAIPQRWLTMLCPSSWSKMLRKKQRRCDTAQQQIKICERCGTSIGKICVASV